jgi:hypothetical protein
MASVYWTDRAEESLLEIGRYISSSARRAASAGLMSSTRSKRNVRITPSSGCPADLRPRQPGRLINRFASAGEWGKRMQCAREGIGQGNGGQGNLVLHDSSGGEGTRTRMDSGIRDWILVPYIPLPAIRLPLKPCPAHSLARDSLASIKRRSRFACLSFSGLLKRPRLESHCLRNSPLPCGSLVAIWLPGFKQLQSLFQRPPLHLVPALLDRALLDLDGVLEIADFGICGRQVIQVLVV